MMIHFTLPLIPSHSAIGGQAREGRPSPLSVDAQTGTSVGEG
ncbi:MAG: hypothetical protein WBC88_00520 [Candidatus Zixiibacteriota bacterium]